MKEIFAEVRVLYDHAQIFGPRFFQGAWTCFAIIVIMFLIHWRLTLLALGIFVFNGIF
jgi:ABC-type multidrug transport system fused ATPase/permease subunit